MIEIVEKYLREVFPMCTFFEIEKIDDKFQCVISSYVSNSCGDPIIRSSTIIVGIVDGFFKIVG